MAIIVDTSVLYTLADRAEPQHRACVAALQGEEEVVVVPQPVLPEVCYLIGTRLGPAAELAFLRGLVASEWRVEPATGGDLDRTIGVLETYSDADIGFVDAALVAIAERLAVTRIYTLDRRDFGLIRPSHVPRFELLP